MKKSLVLVGMIICVMGIGAIALGDDKPATPKAPQPEAVKPVPASDAVMNKLKQITFPKLDIDDFAIQDAVNQLVVLSKEFDKDKQGVKITVDPAVSPTTNVELEDLANITLFDALTMLCKANKLMLVPSADGVVIAPAKAK